MDVEDAVITPLSGELAVDDHPVEFPTDIAATEILPKLVKGSPLINKKPLAPVTSTLDVLTHA
jgi:hypothetical protein